MQISSSIVTFINENGVSVQEEWMSGILYWGECAGGTYTTKISVEEQSGETATHSFEMTIASIVPVLDCIRCGNPLQMKEIKAKACYCEPCKRLVEAAAHQEEVSEAIHRANRRMGL